MRQSATYRRLPPDVREEFNRQVQVFLTDKQITPVETRLSAEARLLVVDPPEQVRDAFHDVVRAWEDRERLIAQSPLFAANKIEAPLLVIQGANDPRVKQAESDQIVAAMHELGREVKYLVAPDEGHGFRAEKNRLDMNVAFEEFLADHLEGRFQVDVDREIARHLETLWVDPATVELDGAPEVAPRG